MVLLCANDAAAQYNERADNRRHAPVRECADTVRSVCGCIDGPRSQTKNRDLLEVMLRSGSVSASARRDFVEKCGICIKA